MKPDTKEVRVCSNCNHLLELWDEANNIHAYCPSCYMKVETPKIMSVDEYANSFVEATKTEAYPDQPISVEEVSTCCKRKVSAKTGQPLCTKCGRYTDSMIRREIGKPNLKLLEKAALDS